MEEVEAELLEEEVVGHPEVAEHPEELLQADMPC